MRGRSLVAGALTAVCGVALPAMPCHVCVEDWVVTNYDTGEYLQAAVFQPPSTYFAVGSNGNVLSSSDHGFSWVHDGKPAGHLQDITRKPCNNLLVAVGFDGTVITSYSGSTWYVETTGVTDHLYAVAYGNGVFIAGGVDGRILVSSDGHSWSASRKSTGRINDFAFSGSGRVAFCNTQRRVYTSDTNGGSWTLRETFPDLSTTCITHGGGVWLVGGRDNAAGLPAIWKSTDDAISWAPVLFPHTSGGYVIDMAYTGKEFVAVGNNFVYSSTDGDTWTHRFTPPTNLYGVAVGELNAVAVGPKGLACASELCP